MEEVSDSIMKDILSQKAALSISRHLSSTKTIRYNQFCENRASGKEALHT